MDYFVTRLYSQGRLTPKHVRHPVRGQLSVCEEHDAERNRMVKIARLVVPASVGKESPPPLYDAVMLGLTGDWLSLSGFERLAAGSLSDLTSWAQTWLCCPAPIEELMAAERKVNELSGRLHDVTVAGGDRRPHREP
jgi:hypothetical protein